MNQKIRITISGGTLQDVEILKGLDELVVEVVDEDENKENGLEEGSVTSVLFIDK